MASFLCSLVAYEAAAVDLVVAERAADARFFVGRVVWQPGERATELAGGAWAVPPPDPDLAFAKEHGWFVGRRA